MEISIKDLSELLNCNEEIKNRYIFAIRGQERTIDDFLKILYKCAEILGDDCKKDEYGNSTGNVIFSRIPVVLSEKMREKGDFNEH